MLQTSKHKTIVLLQIEMENKKINKTFLILILGILAALGPFSIDMYLPAFNAIATDFGTDEKQIALTLTSYFAGIAFGQLIYGPIVDKYGRKSSLLFGLSIYFMASLGCALSSQLNHLIIMRLLQALGGCVGMVASNAIITDVYEDKHRAKAFSSIMLVMGVAPLIAPSIGSLFVAQLHWNYIFYFLAIFSFIVILIIAFFLPETSKELHKNKLRIKEISLNYLKTTTNKTFILYTLSGSLIMAILFAYISSASFIFLSFFNLDKASFSIIFAINASGIISGSYLNGLLTKHIPYRRIAYFTTALLIIISTVATLTIIIKPQLHYYWIVLFIFSTLFLVGFINPNVTAASFTPFKGNLGTASALGGFIRMGVAALVAGAIGIFQSDSLNITFITINLLAILTGILLLFASKVKIYN